MKEKIRIGALISGGGSNLQAIIDACESGKTDGNMVFTGSDNSQANGLKRAEKHGISRFVVDYAKIINNYKKNPLDSLLPEDFDLEDMRKKQFFFPADYHAEKADFFLKTRSIAEAALLAEMKSFEFDLLVLAGFMRNLTPYFIDRINTDPAHPRIMNIHPALLPAFPGTDGYGDTFRYGCRVGGCTVHFIDYGEDSGPIIGQRAFPIEPADTLETVKEKGLRQEWILYPECIQLFAEKRLKTVSATVPAGEHGKSVTRTIVKILER
ncbi:MAG: phosphoribosylglycinamide formyltransferase [Desulfococcaceae bacterium]